MEAFADLVPEVKVENSQSARQRRFVTGPFAHASRTLRAPFVLLPGRE